MTKIYASDIAKIPADKFMSFRLIKGGVSKLLSRSAAKDYWKKKTQGGIESYSTERILIEDGAKGNNIESRRRALVPINKYILKKGGPVIKIEKMKELAAKKAHDNVVGSGASSRVLSNRTSSALNLVAKRNSAGIREGGIPNDGNYKNLGLNGHTYKTSASAFGQTRSEDDMRKTDGGHASIGVSALNASNSNIVSLGGNKVSGLFSGGGGGQQAFHGGLTGIPFKKAA